MDKILKDIELRAETGDPRANEVYLATLNMNQDELADYVATHDAELREILGVHYLVEKDGNPELSKEYFDLLNQGKKMQNPDPYKRQDYYGQDLKDVDYYMDKFGVAKENGEYSNDMRSAFTNKDNPAYFGNYDRDMLANLAHVEGYDGDVDRLLEQIGRVGNEYQRERSARGYDANNDITLAWFGDLAEEFVLPRVREAKLAGRPWSWEDVGGDLTELGLTFIPGVGIAKGAKVVARLPKGARIATNVGLGAVETGAAPIGSQLYDMAAYDENDPRGQWNTERVAAQFAGAAGAKGMIKSGAGFLKNAAELREGNRAGGQMFKGALDYIEDIGNNPEVNIARRGAILEQRADMAANPKYAADGSFVSSEQMKTGYFGDPDDIVNYTDFNIRKAEAEKFAQSQKARTNYEKAMNEQKQAEYAAQKVEADANVLEAKRQAALLKKQQADEKVALAKQELITARDAGDDIVQLSDGRFVYKDTPGLTQGQDWQVGFGSGMTKPAEKEILVLRNFDEPVTEGSMTVGNTVIKEAPRDKVVRKSIANSGDDDMEKIATGRAKYATARDAVANAGFNAAAREGLVGQGIGMDDKRQAALWNRTMMKLCPLVAESNLSPKGKQAMVEAIMNVMTYGLDELPEEIYKKNPMAYKAIAQKLGSDDWSHWSDNKVPDYPTTSY